MTCSFCAALRSTDTIIPHDILGALVLAGAAVAGIVLFPAAWVLWLVVLVVSVGIAVDLSAHGWKH